MNLTNDQKKNLKRKKTEKKRKHMEKQMYANKFFALKLSIINGAMAV